MTDAMRGVASRHTCIYCLRSLSETRFDREHVMPQHLGIFRENMVLHNAVCGNCNNSLGNLLERCLGRDSFEALQRWRVGQKPISEFGKFRGRGVKLRLPPGTAWGGTILSLRGDDETGELTVDFDASDRHQKPWRWRVSLLY
jgi:hypothetical protein